jgi:hypothetical protein
MSYTHLLYHIVLMINRILSTISKNQKEHRAKYNRRIKSYLSGSCTTIQSHRSQTCGYENTTFQVGYL